MQTVRCIGSGPLDQIVGLAIACFPIRGFVMLQANSNTVENPYQIWLTGLRAEQVNDPCAAPRQNARRRGSGNR